MIHVCFALYDKTGCYSKFTGTTMCSLFENVNTPPQKMSYVTVHILHDNTLTQDNRDKFIHLASHYGQRVKFYNVEELCTEEIIQLHRDLPKLLTDRHTIATCYRFFISNLISLDIEKIIYLDSDIVVNIDITELWQIELGNKILGVVTEITNYKSSSRMKEIHQTCRDKLVKDDDYFNAGVLLINLKELRKEHSLLSDGIKFIGNNPQYIFLDQDILNYCFSTRTVKLALKFNRFVATARLEKDFNFENKICHFVSRALNLNINDPFNRLWMKYFMKTPWFNEDTIGRLHDGIQQLHSNFMQLLINFSIIMSGKMRSFIVYENNCKDIKKLFSIKDDEEILVVNFDTLFQDILDKMIASKGKKIFFIFVPTFPYMNFSKLGFVYGRDFINGFEFLSSANGVPFNSYSLIQAM